MALNDLSGLELSHLQHDYHHLAKFGFHEGKEIGKGIGKWKRMKSTKLTLNSNERGLLRPTGFYQRAYEKRLINNIVTRSDT